MNDLLDYLRGTDLRSIGKNEEILPLINSQNVFDDLFLYLYDDNRAVRMKTIDIIEKITVKNNKYLKKHKGEIIEFCTSDENIEFKWHLAQLLPRLEYGKDEINNIWEILKQWALNKRESKIVRVNSLESLYTIKEKMEIFEVEFVEFLKELKKENIASINARIKKLGL
jgi:hypothetical protein